LPPALIAKRERRDRAISSGEPWLPALKSKPINRSNAALKSKPIKRSNALIVRGEEYRVKRILGLHR